MYFTEQCYYSYFKDEINVNNNNNDNFQYVIHYCLQVKLNVRTVLFEVKTHTGYIVNLIIHNEINSTLTSLNPI